MLIILGLFACADVEEDEHDHDHDHEVITRVELELTPSEGGDAIVAVFSDPDNAGEGTSETLTLPSTGSFDLSVLLFNELEEPMEELTGDIEEAGSEHQIFFTGDVDSEASETQDALIEIRYSDSDSNGLPLGLENSLSVLAAGTGELTLSLRHLPPVGDVAQKEAALADTVASEGLVAIPGETDISVTFPLDIQ